MTARIRQRLKVIATWNTPKGEIDDQLRHEAEYLAAEEVKKNHMEKGYFDLELCMPHSGVALDFETLIV